MIPKFRICNMHENMMVTGDQIIIWNGNVYINEARKLSPEKLTGWIVDDKYLMQSTGLKDKNGAEIFEKDIVKNKDGRLAIVKWHGSYASFIYDWIDELEKPKRDWQPLYLSYMKFEVIGNIYENPELLEVPHD